MIQPRTLKFHRLLPVITVTCTHNPVVLDESPNTAAPSLVVCSLCGEVLEGESYTVARDLDMLLPDNKPENAAGFESGVIRRVRILSERVQ